jgi:DNA-binding CsgD family transcriptional regulator
MKKELKEARLKIFADKYVELTKQGMSNSEMVEELKISQNTLNKYRNELGFETIKNSKMDRFAISNKERIIELIDKGANLSELQIELGINWSGLKKVLKNLNITYDKIKTNKYKAQHNKCLEMLELRKEGKTLQEIANVYGVTRELVRQNIAKLKPEIILPSTGVRSMKQCIMCDSKFFSRIQDAKTCSPECNRLHKNKFILTRDDAVKIMEFRDQGKTWNQIGEEYKLENPNLFRIYLQRKISILFSTEEKSKYIKTNEQ